MKIREELNKLDWEHLDKGYNLKNTYDAFDWSNEDKKQIVEMICNKNIKKLYDFLNRNLTEGYAKLDDGREGYYIVRDNNNKEFVRTTYEPEAEEVQSRHDGSWIEFVEVDGEHPEESLIETKNEDSRDNLTLNYNNCDETDFRWYYQDHRINLGLKPVRVYFDDTQIVAEDIGDGETLYDFEDGETYGEVARKLDKAIKKMFNESLNEEVLTEKPDIFGIETNSEIDKEAEDRKKAAHQKRKQIIDGDILTYLRNYTMLDKMAEYDTIEARKDFLIRYITAEVTKDRKDNGKGFSRRFASEPEYYNKPIEPAMVEKMADYILDHYKNSEDFKRGLKFEPKVIKTVENGAGKFELIQKNLIDFHIYRDGKFWINLGAFPSAHGNESRAVEFFDEEVAKAVEYFNNKNESLTESEFIPGQVYYDNINLKVSDDDCKKFCNKIHPNFSFNGCKDLGTHMRIYYGGNRMFDELKTSIKHQISNESLTEAISVIKNDNKFVVLNNNKEIKVFDRLEDAKDFAKGLAKESNKNTAKVLFNDDKLIADESLVESKEEVKDKQNLIKALEIFNENGKYSKRGNWSIARGGYDLDFEVMYDGIPVVDCVNGKLDYNFHSDDVEPFEVAKIIKSVYDDVMLEEFEEALHISQPDGKIWKTVKSSIKFARSKDLEDQADNVMDNLHRIADKKNEALTEAVKKHTVEEIKDYVDKKIANNTLLVKIDEDYRGKWYKQIDDSNTRGYIIKLDFSEKALGMMNDYTREAFTKNTNPSINIYGEDGDVNVSVDNFYFDRSRYGNTSRDIHYSDYYKSTHLEYDWAEFDSKKEEFDKLDKGLEKISDKGIKECINFYNNYEHQGKRYERHKSNFEGKNPLDLALSGAIEGETSHDYAPEEAFWDYADAYYKKHPVSLEDVPDVEDIFDSRYVEGENIEVNYDDEVVLDIPYMPYDDPYGEHPEAYSTNKKGIIYLDCFGDSGFTTLSKANKYFNNPILLSYGLQETAADMSNN